MVSSFNRLYHGLYQVLGHVEIVGWGIAPANVLLYKCVRGVIHTNAYLLLGLLNDGEIKSSVLGMRG